MDNLKPGLFPKLVYLHKEMPKMMQEMEKETFKKLQIKFIEGGNKKWRKWKKEY